MITEERLDDFEYRLINGKPVMPNEASELIRLARMGLWAEKTRFAIESVLWVDQCRCDVAYAGRGMHEPNAKCGELDPLRDALSALPKEGL